MTKDIKDTTLDITIRQDLISQVLPEYFTTDYPNLITFLETYYDYMDSSGEFGECLKDLYDIRDIGSTKLQYIDNMFEEFALGLGQDFFVEPREILRNFAKFFRVKGSLFSAEGFFRSFYNDTDVEIEYPKKDIFLLGDSSSFIGPKSQKIIQDGGVYQILSILIKSKTNLNSYQDLYKKFVHPSGFHLAAEMQIDNNQIITIASSTPQEYIDPDLDLDSVELSFKSQATSLNCHSIAAINSTAILDLSDSAFDSNSLLQIGEDSNAFTLEWGGISNNAYVVRVNNKDLAHTKSFIDSDYYALSDQWGYGIDSINLNTTTVNEFAFNSAPAIYEWQTGSTYDSGRHRTILEFTACEGDSGANKFINSIGKDVYTLTKTTLSDINGKTLRELDNALI